MRENNFHLPIFYRITAKEDSYYFLNSMKLAEFIFEIPISANVATLTWRKISGAKIRHSTYKI